MTTSRPRDLVTPVGPDDTARGLRLGRRASAGLALFGVWSWVIWLTFLKNIWADDRSWSATGGPTAFFLVHAVLIAVSLVIGTAIGGLGLRGRRATRRRS